MLRISLGIILIPTILLAQPRQEDYHLSLAGQLDYADLCSDVWGYWDSAGAEYAIMGTLGGTAVISLADPQNPREVAFIRGTNSIWRDYKSFGDFVFGIADQGSDGLLVIDMSAAPDHISWYFWREEITIAISDVVKTDSLRQAHNIFVDEAGVLYLADARPLHNGVVMLDVSDPRQGIHYLGAFNLSTSHDIFVQKNIAYSSDIFAGVISIWDVTVKSGAILLGSRRTSSNFTHNSWLSSNGQYLYTTDEVSDATIDAYDVSDPSDVFLLDRYQPIEMKGLGVIPHNVHVFNDFLVISYYTEGIKIVDASRPDVLVEVGSYDTYRPFGTGFSGCWGAFPFLPSGLILASDRQSGLIVLDPDYQRAAFLEGIVTDRISGVPIQQVHVSFDSELPNEAWSDRNGVYKTGIATNGSLKVTYHHPSYHIKTFEINLNSGLTQVMDVSLDPRSVVQISGTIFDSENMSGLGSVQIVAEGQAGNRFQTNTLPDGKYVMNVMEDQYFIYAGKWGYLPGQIHSDSITRTMEISAALNPGYADDFSVDLGWQVSNVNLQAGAWIRDVPNPTWWDFGVLSNPQEDLSDDAGSKCYITGNSRGPVGLDDVDGTSTRLQSPAMDLMGMSDPFLSFSYWFSVFGGNVDPDDGLAVQVSNGLMSIQLDWISEPRNIWTSKSYRLKDFIEITSTMKVTFIASDSLGALGHVVEAAVDGFSVIEGNSTSTEDPDQTGDYVHIYPNPGSAEQIAIKYGLPLHVGRVKIMIMSLDQRTIYNGELHGSGYFKLPETNLPPGLYLAMIRNERHVFAPVKFIIQ